MTDYQRFRSVEHALAFAFRHPQGDIGRPLVNRMADGPKRAGTGLGGVDASGQAGMILSSLRSLGGLSYALAAARNLPRAIPCSCGRSCCTGWQRNPDWVRAIETIVAEATVAVKHRRVMLLVRQAVVLRHFGEKTSFLEIAKQCRVDRDTVSAHAKAVGDFVRGKDRQMLSDLRERLAVGDLLET